MSECLSHIDEINKNKNPDKRVYECVCMYVAETCADGEDCDGGRGALCEEAEVVDAGEDPAHCAVAAGHEHAELWDVAECADAKYRPQVSHVVHLVGVEKRAQTCKELRALPAPALAVDKHKQRNCV